ncbi:hypothetical protein HNR77_005957 [Paenibacillus sp. JGP012]|nr:hypothetical protein [Paenibacillus sp. JGP012]
MIKKAVLALMLFSSFLMFQCSTEGVETIITLLSSHGFGGY